MKTLQSVLLEICYHLHYLILKTILDLDQNLRISHLGPKVAIRKTGLLFFVKYLFWFIKCVSNFHMWGSFI